MSKKNIIKNFEKIDNEEKAYWLGFLYADGNVSLKEDKIELSLAEKDLNHIKKFKNFIGLKNDIRYKEKTKSYRFSFRSQNCKADLIDKGCVPNKSLILNFPTFDQVPNHFMRHFIRGYFDGDGWFSNNEKTFQIGIIGTEDFIKGFLEQIPISNKTNKIFTVHRKDGAKRYVFSGLKDVESFLSYIYDDSFIYLDRKYLNFLDFKNNGSKYHSLAKE